MHPGSASQRVLQRLQQRVLQGGVRVGAQEESGERGWRTLTSWAWCSISQDSGSEGLPLSLPPPSVLGRFIDRASTWPAMGRHISGKWNEDR